MRQLQRSGVAVSVIDISIPQEVKQEDKTVVVPRPDLLLMRLTKATGGHHVTAPAMIKRRAMDARLLKTLVDRHRQAYTVRVNVPADLPSPQSVNVTVNRPGATATTASFIEVR